MNTMNNDQNTIFPVSPYTEGMSFLQEDTFYHQEQVTSPTNYQQGDDFRTSFYNPFEIKHRKRTSRAQFKVLEKTFLENPKPNAAIRRWLAQKLSMTPRGVQVWFQNRRAKEKTVSAKKPVTTTTTSPIGSTPPPPPRSSSPPQQQQQQQQQLQNFSSPDQSVCTCSDCFATPMTRTPSYPPFYSDNSSNSEEEELLKTPVTSFVDHTNAFVQQTMYDYPEFMNNASRKMTMPSQDWMFATGTGVETAAAVEAPIWPLSNELAYNHMMFDQRRYSQSIIPEDRFVQSTEIFRRLSEPIYYDQGLHFDSQQFGMLPRNNSF